MEKFFNTGHIAKMCHVSIGSVIRWIHEGKLAAAVTAGGHHRIRGRDLLAFLKTLRMPLPPELENQDGIKILIVDDEESIHRMIRHFLKRQFPDIQVREVSDGFRAGWEAHRLCPDIVILDLVIPGLGGFGVCEFIRSFFRIKTHEDYCHYCSAGTGYRGAGFKTGRQ